MIAAGMQDTDLIAARILAVVGMVVANGRTRLRSLHRRWRIDGAWSWPL